jgi:hypothetical protein
MVVYEGLWGTTVGISKRRQARGPKANDVARGMSKRSGLRYERSAERWVWCGAASGVGKRMAPSVVESNYRRGCSCATSTSRVEIEALPPRHLQMGREQGLEAATAAE